ncbi:MAG: LPS-assembly protein LptD [Treponema sp.]
MKLKVFFFLLFVAFIGTLSSQVRLGRALSEDARGRFSSMEEQQEIKAQEKKTRTIVINSARTTEYKKVNGKKIEKSSSPIEVKISPPLEENITDESVGKKEENTGENDSTTSETKKDQIAEYEKEELVIFIGNVSISVSDGTSTSTIIANRIVYNKNRSTMEATGNVKYERAIGKQVAEKFSGEYLLFDIEKMQGVFFNGIIQQASNKKGRDPFSIHTYIAGKDESGVIGFKGSLLTTSKSEDSLWSIRASRIWILPGSEMAFANGVLSIGVVPLFYLPFFYYPADEMLFHPVFGFRNKEGYFLQTTTYLIGRKPLAKQEKTSSFSNFLQGDTLKKQKLESLFFKKLDEDASIQDPAYLKVMFDMYSRLGYLVGIEGKFTPKKSYVRDIDFNAFIGFSNTIYPIASGNSLFSTFAPGSDKKGELNKSNFFGKVVPFRYNFNFNMSLTKDPFNVAIAFPFISDPFFKKDFMNRSEDMNWFNYMLNKDRLAKESSNTSEETSYVWRLTGNVRPSFPILRPWISSISIDDISTALNFYSKSNSKLTGLQANYSPERKFYYPQSLKPSFKLSMSGTIFSTSMLENKKKNTTKKEIDPLLKEIKNPFLEEVEEKKEIDQKHENKLKKISELNDEELKEKIAGLTESLYTSLLDSCLPLYKGVAPSSSSYFFTNIFKYDLTYRLNGQAIYESIFDHDEWKEPKDIKWNKFYSKFYQLKGDASINSSLSFYRGLVTLTNTLAFSSNYQDHPYVKDATRANTLKLNNYKMNIYTLKNSNTLNITPFLNNIFFKPITFSWTMSETLLQRKFVGTVSDPKWEIEKVKWNKDMITSHSASTVLGFVIGKYTQTFNLSMNLKPLLSAYTFSSVFNIPYVKFSLSTKYFEKENASKKWFWEPLKFTTSFSLPFNISLSQEYVYNIEDKKHDKFALNFSWKYVSFSYTMTRTLPYKLNASTGWQADGTEKKFIPSAFDLSFSNSSKPLEFYSWKNRIHFQASFSSSLHFNLVRLTDSYFTFAPKVTFKIYEFVDISFGAMSRNDSIVKYFGNSFNLPITFQGETNIFKDILYSFFFWDKEKRQLSDFKLKSVNFELTHHLKDWTMTISYSIKPTLKTVGSRKTYNFDPTISFFVQWNPIGDIKIKAKEEEKKFSVERGEIK